MPVVIMPFDHCAIEVANVSGVTYVSLESICNAIGLDLSTQLDKIRNDPSYKKEWLPHVTLYGKQREAWFISNQNLQLWLSSIDAESVVDCVRERLNTYLTQCYPALLTYIRAQPVSQSTFTVFMEQVESRYAEIVQRIEVQIALKVQAEACAQRIGMAVFGDSWQEVSDEAKNFATKHNCDERVAWDALGFAIKKSVHKELGKFAVESLKNMRSDTL